MSIVQSDIAGRKHDEQVATAWLENTVYNLEARGGDTVDHLSGVPNANLGRLRDDIEALNRKARKRGWREVELLVGPVYSVERWVERRDPTGEERPVLVKRVVRVSDVVFTVPDMVIAGWEFVGVIQPAEGGTVVRSVPGKTVPSWFRTADAAHCDHCNVRRHRNEVYVLHWVGKPGEDNGAVKAVMTSDGLHMQVGSTCVKDFLGIDPGHVAALAAWYEARGSYGEPGGGSYLPPLDDWMAAVACAARTEGGFVSRKQADNDYLLTATGAVAADIFHRAGEKIRDHRGLVLRIIPTPNEDDRTNALACITYVRGLDDSQVVSEYMHNLKVIFAGDHVPDKGHGLATSAYGVWLRSLERERERKARVAARPSRHLGAEKERITFDAMVTGEHISEGDFGTTHIYKLTTVGDGDRAGDRLTWFSSNPVLTVGHTYRLKGTVKKHDEYRGEEQTVVTRCAIVKVLEG